MKKTLLSFLAAALALSTFATSARADVTLPKCFGDNAVLQRDKPICVWGWADAGEQVTVAFAGTTAKATAGEDGAWKVYLPAQPASFEARDLVVEGKNKVAFSNVLVGEVWICSGQSNMEQPLNSWGQPRLSCTEAEINGDFGFVRFNRAHHVIKSEEQKDFATNGWLVCKDGVQKDCTACGFHFAVRLNKELNVPVGLIDSNWGGSNINSWIPDAGWNEVPETVEVGKKLLAARDGAKDWDKCGGMYNAMLAPWKNYSIRGAIWYQGCSNAGEREFYYYKQKAMIREWREVFNQGDFPFYWVQLASFTDAQDDPNNTGDWPYLRRGQQMCLEVRNTGQAVIIDAGEAKDIHPRNKWIVGNRLAVWALAHTFNKDVECASPVAAKADFADGKATITFDFVGSGLVVGKLNDREFSAVDGKLARFAVAGKDGKFVWADAQIVGKNQVVVSAESVAEPTAVRYAWQMNPDGANLYSAEGLPAAPFEIVK